MFSGIPYMEVSLWENVYRLFALAGSFDLLFHATKFLINGVEKLNLDPNLLRSKEKLKSSSSFFDLSL